MTHIMLDLETFSTKPNARILAIGAVKFDAEQGVYDKFYQAVLTEPWAYDLSMRPLMQTHTDDEGFHIDHQTLQWWNEQSDVAQSVFTDPNAVSVEASLKSFFTWGTTGISDIREVRMWGNGASFDNVILSTAYDIASIQQPWEFWNDRCYRTVKNLIDGPPLVRHGTHHNALNDAESQAEHLLALKVNLA